AMYLEVFGHIVIAWIWLEQMCAIDDRAGAFYAGKRKAGQYFFRYELPKTTPMLTLLGALDCTTKEFDPDPAVPPRRGL
ncbi:MAG TPA: acyl-CoA dehydrogenase C-terminal domain-containing protein, partial [Galbitalea sp.]